MFNRNHKLAVARRAKNQSLRRPVDERFQGFTPYEEVEVKEWSPNGGFEQYTFKGKILHFIWPN